MFKKTCLWLMVVVCSLNLSGCIFLLIPAAIGIVGGVGIGIGTAKWMSDKLVEQVPHPMDQVHKAVLNGIKDLQIGVIKEAGTDTLIQISCKYPDGRTVWINVVRVSNTISRIEVRVGVWGGQPEARKVLEGILARL